MNQQPRTIQDHLDELMDMFDFPRVVRTMQALEWTWVSCDGVPTEAEIRQAVRRYAKQAMRQALEDSGHAPGRGFVGTGGFHIEAVAENGAVAGLYARFEVTQWTTFD